MTVATVNLGDSEGVGTLNIICCQCCQECFFFRKAKGFQHRVPVYIESDVTGEAGSFSALSVEQDQIYN